MNLNFMSKLKPSRIQSTLMKKGNLISISRPLEKRDFILNFNLIFFEVKCTKYTPYGKVLSIIQYFIHIKIIKSSYTLKAIKAPSFF